MHQPPFRAEHIGSLLRPLELLELRESVTTGEATQEQLENLENSCIEEIVKLQQDLGFHAITDGEYRRHVYWGTFFTDLEGFQDIEVNDQSIRILRDYVPDFKLFTKYGQKGAKTSVCTSKIKHVRSTFTPSFEFLKGLVKPEDVRKIKITMGSPHWFHFRYRPGQAYPANAYSSDDEYYRDVAAAFQAEFKDLYAAGCRNFQIDDPAFAYFCDERFVRGWQDDPDNKKTVDEVLDEYIDLLNDSISKLPSDAHVGLHLCRGNFMSGYWAIGGYEHIAKKVFQKAKVHTILLEYDTDRAGGFEPLQELPLDKNVVLGLISTKIPELEDGEQVKQRIAEATKAIAKGSGQSEADALRRMSISPQCGFASASIGNKVNKADMINKLKLVRQLADAVWVGQP